MNDRVISDLRAGIEHAAQDDSELPSGARAFGSWIGEPPRKILDELTVAALAHHGPLETADAASLGYGSSVNPKLQEDFANALKWMEKCEYFRGRALSFEVDGYRLLGMAAGIQQLPEAEQSVHRAWLADLTRRSIEICRDADWNASLVAAAHFIVSGDRSALERISPDLRIVLASRALAPPVSSATREHAYSVISDGHSDGAPRAAAHVMALKILLRESLSIRFDAPTVESVAELLRGLSRSMKRWAWDKTPRSKGSVLAKWQVANEYHVQDLLWVILAPIFPDLDDEEWLTSLGFHHPRADLAIASLGLIIEVKFLRKATAGALSALTTEVAADASTYLQNDSRYRQMIAFVWDDTASTEKHEELRQGITRIKGVVDAIVLPRPAKMRDP